MEDPDSSIIDSKVQKSLEGTLFASSNLKKLEGGSVNWIYHAPLDKPLEDGTTEVAVKHGEPYMATKPEFELNFVRCGVEAECFKALSDYSITGTTDPTDSYRFIVRTPKFYLYDEANVNQISEYLPRAVGLKEYILQHCPAPTPESFRPQFEQLGKAIGRWRRNFADWSERQSDLRRIVAENRDAPQVRHMLNFLWMYERIKEYPAILGGVADILAQVEKAAREERQDEDKLSIVHGDFWTGNVIIPNHLIEEGKDVPVFVIDWEIAHLGVLSIDYGQMMAELYALWLYKGITAGLWVMEGYADAYGDVSEAFAFRAAIQMGTHLLCITTTFPGWGTPQRVEDVACVGRDIIVHAWEKDRDWFEKSELACLFRRFERRGAKLFRTTH